MHVLDVERPQKASRPVQSGERFSQKSYESIEGWDTEVGVGIVSTERNYYAGQRNSSFPRGGRSEASAGTPCWRHCRRHQLAASKQTPAARPIPRGLWNRTGQYWR